MSLKRYTVFIGNRDHHARSVFVPALLLIVLFLGLAQAQIQTQTQAQTQTATTTQSCATGIQVIWISASPSTVTVGTTVNVDFKVVTYSPEEYLGCVSNPVTDLKTGSFIVSPESNPLASMLGALQSSLVSEHDDLPLSLGATPGEYLTNFQTTQSDPTGNVLVYIKALSLQTVVNGTAYVGPVINVSSVQTPDTSDNSLVNVLPKEQPSIWTQLMQSNVLPLLFLAALIILIILISILARRRRKTPASSKAVAAKT